MHRHDTTAVYPGEQCNDKHKIPNDIASNRENKYLDVGPDPDILF